MRPLSSLLRLFLRLTLPSFFLLCFFPLSLCSAQDLLTSTAEHCQNDQQKTPKQTLMQNLLQWKTVARNLSSQDSNSNDGDILSDSEYIIDELIKDLKKEKKDSLLDHFIRTYDDKNQLQAVSLIFPLVKEKEINVTSLATNPENLKIALNKNPKKGFAKANMQAIANEAFIVKKFKRMTLTSLQSAKGFYKGLKMRASLGDKFTMDAKIAAGIFPQLNIVLP